MRGNLKVLNSLTPTLSRKESEFFPYFNGSDSRHGNDDNYNPKGSIMRKTLINLPTENTTPSDLDYLDLEHLAQVEISSESQEHPIESAW